MSDKTKQAKIDIVREMFNGVTYPTPTKKEDAIKSFSESNLSMDFIRDFTNQVKEYQGRYKHYS